MVKKWTTADHIVLMSNRRLLNLWKRILAVLTSLFTHLQMDQRCCVLHFYTSVLIFSQILSWYLPIFNIHPQVSKPLLETSRNGYLAALSASSYSFVSLLKHFLTIMNPGMFLIQSHPIFSLNNQWKWTCNCCLNLSLSMTLQAVLRFL